RSWAFRLPVMPVLRSFAPLESVSGIRPTGLKSARDALKRLSRRPAASVASRVGVEARNRWVVARAVAEAAAWRTESRGAHYRSDHPEADDRSFRAHSVERRGAPVAAVPVGRGPLALNGSG
ncbi:MAG: hypothetical protein LAO51_15170, partial [Acidobacteriia bacterium]|nr:hypothetical protein [Terriglobia bacterium]